MQIMSFRNIGLVFVFIFAAWTIQSQSVEAQFDFNNCSFQDATNSYGEPTTTASPNCTCGVTGDALSFTGTESLNFPDLDMALQGDFTMSFYFFPKGDTMIMDIISITNDVCNYDSTMHITYSPEQNKVKVDFQERPSKRAHLEGTLDINKCWHHIVITHKDNQYDLYIDEKRVDVKSIPAIAIKPDARFKISGNSCIGPTLSPYIGLLDELYIWDYALNSQELVEIHKSPDQIITKDQTIFLGEQIQINTGEVCSSNFSWSPNNEFQQTGVPNPIITPTKSQSYTFNVSYPTCKITDTVTIYVIDPEALDCNEILLPKAFTPNNDGLNEEFGISNKFIIENLKSFDIFDKWANTVFQTTDKHEKWDGSLNGEKLNPGLYVYKISYTCKTKTYNKTGSFSLLR